MICSRKLTFKPENCINFDKVSEYNKNHYQIESFSNPTEYSKFFSEEFLSLLERYSPINCIIVFCKPKFWRASAHTDAGFSYALNIVPYSSDIPSYMQWFKVKNSDNRELKWTGSGTPFYGFNDSEIEQVDETNTDNSVMIVRTDLPHKIKVGGGSRVCISIRFDKLFNTWDDVVNYYSDLGWVE
jgi:hypothetical protein